MHASTHYYMLSEPKRITSHPAFFTMCVSSLTCLTGCRPKATAVEGLNVDFISGLDNFIGISIVYIKGPKTVLQ